MLNYINQGENTMEKRKLDIDILNNEATTVSSEKSLEDDERIEWSRDVVSGEKKVAVDKR